MILKVAKCSVLAIISLTMNSYGASMAQTQNIQKHGFVKGNKEQNALLEGCHKRMSAIKERVNFLQECIDGLKKGIAKLKSKLPITYPPLLTDESKAVNAQIVKAEGLIKKHESEISTLISQSINIQNKLNESGLSLQEKLQGPKTSPQIKIRP